ncbi:MAG: hypothetical protein KC415_05420 [Anaerolineales bacterium]|nr:hypothetical protein [Anaerolineales bacterium]
MIKDKVKATKLTVGLPFNLGQLEFEPDEVEQQAAWEIYVELATRVTITPLSQGEGRVREALESLYKIVQITRDVLRKAGPSVAKGSNSVGSVAIEVVVKGIRPFLTKWHPLLLKYEQDKPDDLDSIDYERKWSESEYFYGDLGDLQEQMNIYLNALAIIAGVKTD